MAQPEQNSTLRDFDGIAWTKQCFARVRLFRKSQQNTERTIIYKSLVWFSSSEPLHITAQPEQNGKSLVWFDYLKPLQANGSLRDFDVVRLFQTSSNYCTVEQDSVLQEFNVIRLFRTFSNCCRFKQIVGCESSVNLFEELHSLS